MGANAQTTVPTFSAGQVLTADQQNQSARTGVPVFAGTTERDAAFGGTGEKTLAEGQLCYLEDANVVQYYDGSSWATVGPAAAGAFTRITGATFSTAGSVAFANDTFTASYNQYRVIFYNTTQSTAPVSSTIVMQVRDNSGAKTGAQYYGGFDGVGTNSVATLVGTNAATSFNIGAVSTAGYSGIGWYALDLTVYAPTDSGVPTRWSGTGYGFDSSFNRAGSFTVGGLYSANEAHTGLLFTFGNTFSGRYDVYGMSS
jgi:hypothetical protein